MSDKIKIVYISSLCSSKKYYELFDKLHAKLGFQIQKYHSLLVSGFKANKNIDVVALSALPITQDKLGNLYYRKSKEWIDGIQYIYLSFISLPIIRHLFLLCSCFFYSIKISKQNENQIAIICDGLNISISVGGLLAAKMMKKRSVCIVTDIPTYLVNSSKKNRLTSLIAKINSIVINKFDSYVFLTEQMNDLINTQRRPYVVLEGHVDIKMKNTINSIENKNEKKICIYAGSLKNIYGIKMLTEAFLIANNKESELHIYGSGDFEEELIEICKDHSNIKYFGVKPNDYVVNEQLKATLLINPRPTNEEYTKYSFPSKNMEYMVSGTPVLTTKLPGMPEEYYPHVYLIEDESVEGLTKILKNILSKDREELHEKGRLAKEFVLNEKNNVVQAEKIICMVKKLTSRR